MKTTAALSFFLLIFSFNAQAQDCSFDLCASDQCGSLNVKFTPKGGPVFCDGEEIIFENISDTGFTYFVVDWRDGSTDTLYDNSNFSHVYNVPDSLLCKGGDEIFYSVCFKGVKECPAGITCQSGTYAFGIRKKPKALFGSGDVCFGNPFSFFNLSCHALTAEWEFGDGNGSWEDEPIHTYDSLGNYIVRLIATNSCGADTAYGAVQVVLSPEASFDRKHGFSAYCDTLPVTESFYNTSNVYSTHTRWKILPADSTKWMFTDTLMTLFNKNIEVSFLDTGTFIIELTAWNDCGESIVRDTIRILKQPNYAIYPPPIGCDSVIVTPLTLGFQYAGPIDSCVWTFFNGVPDKAVGFSFPPVSFYNTGTVQLIVHSPCGKDTLQVQVGVPKSSIITFPGVPAGYCQNGPPLQLIALPNGGMWTGLGPAAGSISNQGMLQPSGLSPGHYTYQYSLQNVVCPVDATISIEILDEPGILLNPEPIVCGTLLYNPEVSYTGDIQSYQWSFPGANPPVSNLAEPVNIYYGVPGTYPVFITATGACGETSDTTLVEIQPPLNLQITAPPPPLCTHSAPFYMSASLPGGTWFGPGILDPVTGLFDPSAVPGNQTITVSYFLMEGVCEDTATIQFQVNIPQEVQIWDRFFCINNPPAFLQATKPGGIWSGPGIVNPQFGLFNPAVAGVGTFTVHYVWTDPNGCTSSDSAQVVVETMPQISVADTTLFCFVPQEIDLAQTLGYTADPPGGTTTWSGPGVNPATGTFNPVQAGLPAGTYLVNVLYQRNGCQVSKNSVITLIHLIPLVMPPDTVLCVSAGSLTLPTNIGGGIWSGPGIDSLSGVIDLEAAGGGIKTYSYLLHAGTSCEQKGQVVVEIIDPAASIQLGPDLVICEGPSELTFLGFSPSGGTWTGPNVTDPVMGVVDLSQLAPGNYTYQYCLTSLLDPDCSSCRPLQLTVHPKPEIDFGLEGYPCVDAPFSIIDSSENAFTYFWDFGDGTTSTEKEPEHTYGQEGSYQLSVIITSDMGCQDTLNADYFVTTPPLAGFQLVLDEGCAPFPLEVVNTSSGYGITELWLIQGDSIFGSDPGTIIIDEVTQDSTITVHLQVTNVCGTEIWEEEVLVHPYPQVSFGFNVDEGCSPLTISFANQSVGNPDNFFWDLGNGVQVTDVLPPPQIYTTDDSTVTVYTVSLISTNACGTDTLTKEITVYPPDVRAFIGLEESDGCQPLLVTPQNYSTPGSNYSWQVYNEMDSLIYTSILENPSFLLNQPGWHTIILLASRCGMDTDTARVLVHPAPQVAFSHLPYICEGSPIQFTNSSQNISGQLWDFGDGTQSDQVSPIHQFNQPGIYTVTLTGFSLFNNCPDTMSSLVEVLAKPIADFTPSVYQGCSPLTVQFADASIGQQGLQYVWSFGDGSSAEFSTDPEHVFEQAGSYLVLLQVYDINGCFSDSSYQIIQVYPSPQGQISLPSGALCFGQEPLLLSSSYQDAVTFEWTINGQSFTSQQVMWTPPGTGPVEVELIVGNQYQCKDTSALMFEILPSPEAAFTSDIISGCEDLEVQFTNGSVHSDYYFWNFGDQTTSVEGHPAKLYTEPGTWTAQLVALSTNGCPADTATLTILVHPTPEVDFSHVKSMLCGVPHDVTFTNLTTKADAWIWTFGDGSGTIERDPVQTFSSPGIHEIQLIASNMFLCRDTMVRQLEILGQPVADFDLDAFEGCSPLQVSLQNLSTQALSYEWQVEGLGVFNTENPVLSFEAPGSYGITLIAFYTDACRDTLHLPGLIRVYQTPDASFTHIVNSEENILGDVQFTNTSTNAHRYFWDLGDGTTTTATDVDHVYDFNRSIEVMLVAFNDNGGLYTCVDTALMLIDPEWITTFYAPNAMTPEYGEEGIRVFRPVGIGIEEYEIAVYSPWGELLWVSTDLEDHRPSGSWDGTYRGEIVPQGAYAWLARLRFVNGTTRTVKGTVTVLR